MADFVAVLKNAIDEAGDDRSATRERVYQKARAIVAARLAVVGPPPSTVVERHKRVLEDAIAEVESSYFDEVDDDPIAELANIFDYSRRPPLVGTVAPNTEAAFPTLVVEDYAPELPPPVNVAPANDAGAAQHLLALAPPADLQAPSEPIVVEVTDFRVLGEAHATLGNELGEMLADGANAMEFGTHRLSGLTSKSSHQLGWDSSSLCGLCQRWALCIDQTDCWHRTNR
jgi:hypothetical protein